MRYVKNMLSCGVLCEELSSRGLFVEKKNLNLDSKKIADQIFGIEIRTGDINKSIVFPVDSILEGASSIKEAADFIQAALEDSKLPEDVDYDYFLSKDYILSHVQLGLTERMWEPFLYRDSIFEGIIEYCYIAGIFRKNRWMIEIREDIIKSCQITQEDLWAAAKTNTFKSSAEFVLKPVADIMGNKLKKLIDVSPVQYMYSISNLLGLQGAVQVLNPKVSDLFDKYSVENLIIYFQSENNVLIAPVLDGVQETLKNIAENDTNYRYLSSNLYIINKDIKVTSVISFKSIGS